MLQSSNRRLRVKNENEMKVQCTGRAVFQASLPRCIEAARSGPTAADSAVERMEQWGSAAWPMRVCLLDQSREGTRSSNDAADGPEPTLESWECHHSITGIRS